MDADAVPAEAEERILCLRTKSDKDVLDDGFKWKKYGQKYIKHRIHPRFYFRCRTSGCPVKKQVERCSEDPEYVVTSYNGIHSHTVPHEHSSAISSSLSIQRNAFDLRFQVFGLHSI